MNETFKNSLKGFKVKGILLVLGAIVTIILAAHAFNTGTGFHVLVGIIAILAYIGLVIKAIIDNKKANESIDEKEREISRLGILINQLEAKNKELKANYDSEKSFATSKSKEVSNLKNQLADANAKVEALAAAYEAKAGEVTVEVKAEKKATKKKK